MAEKRKSDVFDEDQESKRNKLDASKKRKVSYIDILYSIYLPMNAQMLTSVC